MLGDEASGQVDRSLTQGGVACRGAGPTLLRLEPLDQGGSHRRPLVARQPGGNDHDEPVALAPDARGLVSPRALSHLDPGLLHGATLARPPDSSPTRCADGDRAVGVHRSPQGCPQGDSAGNQPAPNMVQGLRDRAACLPLRADVHRRPCDRNRSEAGPTRQHERVTLGAAVTDRVPVARRTGSVRKVRPQDPACA